MLQQQRNIRSNQIQNSQPQIQSQMQPQVQTHLQQIPQQRGMNSTNSQLQMHTNQTQQILSNQSQQVHHSQNQHQQVITKLCWWKSAKVFVILFLFGKVLIKTPFQFNYSQRKLDISSQCLIMIQVQ